MIIAGGKFQMLSVNGIPKAETIWTKINTGDNEIYYITSKENREYYFLYKMENNKTVKVGKEKSPLDLETKYIKENK